MERFKTLSEKLIKFYSHRFSIAEERLSWAVVYISEEGETYVASVLKIKDSDDYINIQYDMIMKKIPEDHDLVLFNMIDAWFSEADKNLRYGHRSGRVSSVVLDLSTYLKFNK